MFACAHSFVNLPIDLIMAYTPTGFDAATPAAKLLHTPTLTHNSKTTARAEYSGTCTDIATAITWETEILFLRDQIKQKDLIIANLLNALGLSAMPNAQDFSYPDDPPKNNILSSRTTEHTVKEKATERPVFHPQIKAKSFPSPQRFHISTRNRFAPLSSDYVDQVDLENQDPRVQANKAASTNSETHGLLQKAAEQNNTIGKQINLQRTPVDDVSSKKRVAIFSDSIARGIRKREFNYWLRNHTASFHAFPGVTAQRPGYYMLPYLREQIPDSVILHSGINNLTQAKAGCKCMPRERC